MSSCCLSTATTDFQGNKKGEFPNEMQPSPVCNLFLAPDSRSKPKHAGFLHTWGQTAFDNTWSKEWMSFCCPSTVTTLTFRATRGNCQFSCKHCQSPPATTSLTPLLHLPWLLTPMFCKILMRMALKRLDKAHGERIGCHLDCSMAATTKLSHRLQGVPNELSSHHQSPAPLPHLPQLLTPMCCKNLMVMITRELEKAW